MIKLTLSIYQPERLRNFLAGLSRNLRKIAVEAAGDQAEYYLRNNTEPPEKYVTRKAAYGVSFFTDRQRRWFFAALNSGAINVPYQRTHELAESWDRKDNPESVNFFNKSPAAPWTIGDSQTRHEKLVGWRHWTKILQGGMKEIVNAAKRAVRDYLQQRPWK